MAFVLLKRCPRDDDVFSCLVDKRLSQTRWTLKDSSLARLFENATEATLEAERLKLKNFCVLKEGQGLDVIDRQSLNFGTS